MAATASHELDETDDNDNNNQVTPSFGSSQTAPSFEDSMCTSEAFEKMGAPLENDGTKDACHASLSSSEAAPTAERAPNPWKQASWLSRLLFTWPYPLLKLGMERPLQEEDLPSILASDGSTANRLYLQGVWDDEVQRHGRKKASLHRAILLDFFTSIWYVQPLICAATIAKVVQAVALGLLIQTFEDGFNASEGYLWAGVLVGCAMVVLFEHHHVFFITWHKGMRLRIGFVASIYDKSLRLSSTNQVSSASSGKIMNLASNDVERFLMAALFINYLLWAPIQSFAILGVGIKLLGPAFVAGFGLLVVIFAPMQFYLSQRFAKYRSKIAEITDRRVTLVSQAVGGARVVKMSGWEFQFLDRIQAIRKEEISQIRRANRLKAWNEALFFSSNVVISIVIFIVHVASGGVLSPRNVFTVMSLVNVLQLEMTKHLSLGVMGASEVYVSISRIQNFLQFPEIGDDSHVVKEEQPDESNDDNGEVTAAEQDEVAVLSLSNVTCYWNSVGESSSKDDASDDSSSRMLFLALSDISLEFRMKELTCVIGPVGSGKSALLQALVGELPLSEGTMTRTCKTISYAAQDPWIMDGTVRENILMGNEWNKCWYDKVVNACGLDIDFKQLRQGDTTIVGDRGVQLSGGQRARIGLARALYIDADLLVCDDPLSAVDAKVGRLIFYEAIQGLAIGRGKCVVLATHQHQYVSESRCVLMTSGRVECVGTYADCVKESGGKLTAHAPDTAADNTDPSSVDKLSPLGVVETVVPKIEEKEEERLINEDEGKELNVTGLVHLDTFIKYFKAMGGVWVGCALLLLFCVTQASVLVTIAALGRWAERPPAEQGSPDIIGLILGLGCAVVILAVFRAMVCYHLTIKASRILHDRMTKAVLRAKIAFFDQNPIGRILNRFSADVGSNDDLLPQTLFDFLVVLFIVLGAIITTIAVLPFVLIVVPLLMWYFIRVRRIFVTTSRELKRLEGLARSPIFAMMSESLSGVATIRANDCLDYFKRKFEYAHDAHSRAFFSFIASSRWVGFRMDSLMFLFLALASFLSVLVNVRGWFGGVDPAILGLALSMLLQLAGLFQWCIRQSAEVINLMVAVERVLAFGAVEPEAPLVLDGDAALLDKGWPTEGSVSIQDLSVRYRPSLPLSLEDVTFDIPSGARVGCVGRTGSGKSTLVQSLFRLLEPDNGSIRLAGIDIQGLGLHTLRTHMSVISQVPVLFSGCSVRENLDPFQTHSDETLKDALDDVHMTDAINDLPQGWNSMVAENGSNFSVGQRQLLCLARAILCKNKVLVCDEPTANVDRRTDELLQQALHKSFQGSTIISVAHRLDTIIDNDFVLVLGHGHVLEFASPWELLENENSHFSSIVNDTGETMARDLRRRALEAKKNR